MRLTQRMRKKMKTEYMEQICRLIEKKSINAGSLSNLYQAVLKFRLFLFFYGNAIEPSKMSHALFSVGV